MVTALLTKRSNLALFAALFVFTIVMCGYFAVPAYAQVVITPTPFDLNGNGIPDKDEPTVVVASNIELPAGKYTFNNLIIANNVTLFANSDQSSTDAFKGVEIDAVNLTIDSTSSISAAGKGYSYASGPGASTVYGAGASYGGMGTNNTETGTYGSATKPIDLGSGGGVSGYSSGGGALQIKVSGTFVNDGLVTSNGLYSSSGGSIYVTANQMSGVGTFSANGGDTYCVNTCSGLGGGGRIALYYGTSTFTGTATANGGRGWYGSIGNSGTVGFFDTTNNDFYAGNAWRFQANDSPLSFHDIFLKNGAKVTSENGANITAEDFVVDGASKITLSGGETISANTLLVTGGSTVSVVPEHILSLTIQNITVDSGSTISADDQGYLVGLGSPDTYYETGASYGGVGGGINPKPAYGSATAPIDFGSGTAGRRGGGAMRLIVSGTLQNDGIISANGVAALTSGGSLYITTNHITGNGTFRANGGDAPWPYLYKGGGGGRIAVYYQDRTFNGVATALAGVSCFYGCAPAAGDGTVGFFNTSDNSLDISSSWRFQANDSPLNFSSIILRNGAKVNVEKDAIVSSDSLLVNGASSLTLSGNSILNIPDVTIAGASTVTLSGEETINTNTLLVNGNSVITVLPERTLSLKIQNITVGSGSIISADGKGYLVGPGSPDTYYEAGASHGGVGGGATARPAYGTSTAPIDFGSGTEGNRGGGAIRLAVDGLLQNDGIISANGNSLRTSGGSVYITANTISGSGVIKAKGGDSAWPYGPIGGAGGRIAVYYKNNSFTGEVSAPAGIYCFYGCAPAGGAGTVVIKQTDPPCTVGCYSNVLFLPGVEASRLYRAGDNGDEDKLWEPGIMSNSTPDLFLNDQGNSIRNDIYLKPNGSDRGVIDNAYGIPYKGDVYASFINQMNDLRDNKKLINDWEAAPYDWRLSLEDILSSGNQISDGSLYYGGTQGATSTPYIIQELRHLAATSRTGKVTIVAHSNGGLVTKALTDKLGSEASSLIDKIIFVAVPQVGTPEAIGALLHGFDQGLPTTWAPIAMTPQTARTFASTTPATYNLLPSANYYNSTGANINTPMVTFDDGVTTQPYIAAYGHAISNYTELKNFIVGNEGRPDADPTVLDQPSKGKLTLMSDAEAVHQTLDAWTPPQGVSLYQIAGWGEDTLGSIEYKDGMESVCHLTQPSYPFTKSYCVYTFVPTIMFEPKEVIDGDGTVVAPSALAMSTSTANTSRYWVDLRAYGGSNLGTTINRKHADILEVPELRTLIQGVITDSISTLPVFTFITPSQPTSDADANKRLRFLLHSPLNLSVVDNLGNETSATTFTIPGADYRRYGEVQVLTVPEHTPITLNLAGYASGSFTLDLQEIDGTNTVIASSTIEAVPSATSTKATMALIDGTIQNASPLLVDYDGDNHTDFSVTPVLGKTIVADLTPPEAQITFSTSTKSTVIIGTDTQSSTMQITIPQFKQVCTKQKKNQCIEYKQTKTGDLTTIMDAAGNTLSLVTDSQNDDSPSLHLTALKYSIQSATTTTDVSLRYTYHTDRKGNTTNFNSIIRTPLLRTFSLYIPRTNETIIFETVLGAKNYKNDTDDNDDENHTDAIQIKPDMYPKQHRNTTMKRVQGMVVPYVATERGSIVVKY